MKVTADTNVLIRAVVQDDPVQSKIAARLLTEAKLITIALPSLCEFVWVLRKIYDYKTTDICATIRVLLATNNVKMNNPAVEAGLNVLEAGGDFADGVSAYEGSWLGADTFVSFDKKAVKILSSQGISARLL